MPNAKHIHNKVDVVTELTIKHRDTKGDTDEKSVRVCEREREEEEREKVETSRARQRTNFGNNLFITSVPIILKACRV